MPSGKADHIVISAENLHDEEWAETLRILIGLMSTPESAEKYREGVSLRLQGSISDHKVRDYFRHLHQFFPLWVHFIARDGSLDIVVRALCSDDGASVPDPNRVREFILESVTESVTFCRMNGMHAESSELYGDVSMYLHQQGLLLDNA